MATLPSTDPVPPDVTLTSEQKEAVAEAVEETIEKKREVLQKKMQLCEEYNGGITNIPMNSPYWDWKNQLAQLS